MKINMFLIVLGMLLIGFSQMTYALYNPYVNYGYERPYYSQYNGIPGYPRDPLIYGGINHSYAYNNGFEYYNENISTRGYGSYGGYYYTTPYRVSYPTGYNSFYPISTSYYASPGATYNAAGYSIAYWG